MKDPNDKITADLFEMSDADILKWLGEHVYDITKRLSDYKVSYMIDGAMYFKEAPTLKEAVRKAAQNDRL